MSQREDNTSTDLPLEACLLKDGSNFPDVLEGSFFIQRPAHGVFVSLLRHLFLTWRMLGSQPDVHEPGPAPRHLCRGRVRWLHAPARGTASAAAGSCPHTALGTPTCPAPGSVPPPQLLHGHFYPSKSVPPHPGHGSRSAMLVTSHPTQRAQPLGGCLMAWQWVALPRRGSQEPAWFRNRE